MTLNYNSATALRAFLEQEGLAMQKKFGQNFLINPETRKALVQALDVQNGDEIWEIGPGLGAMTALLLENGVKVKAFEIDIGFIRILKNIFSENKNFTLVEGDVMKTWQAHQPVPFLFGNLPYNVAAALLADLIENDRIFSRMVVTVQKEVAQRMAAVAGKPDYSSFSVLCASAYKVKPLMTIRPSSFYPQPNVDSMAVLLEKKDAQKYPAVFYPLVRALFASRRKTIKNNLSTFLSARFGESLQNKSAVQELCASVLQSNSLNGGERAESLELESFLSIALSIDNMRL
ncbi:16S rRNA (adenine(1518)-N(6)/adenine(1519)-N(6))-dimethyltransferase RsmA [Treponema sp. R6D11]